MVLLTHCKGALVRINHRLVSRFVLEEAHLRQADVFLRGRFHWLRLVRIRITSFVSIDLHLHVIVLFLIRCRAVEIGSIESHSHDLHLTRLISACRIFRAIHLKSSHDRCTVDHFLSV